MSAREYVAGQLIRLARKLDPNCAVDWTQLREQELSGLCYWCFEKATRDLYGVPLCDKHTDAELWKEGQ